MTTLEAVTVANECFVPRLAPYTPPLKWENEDFKGRISSGLNGAVILSLLVIVQTRKRDQRGDGHAARKWQGQDPDPVGPTGPHRKLAA